jgi:membrane-bound acyltransferase YfiQ involved in biofilm formation
MKERLHFVDNLRWLTVSLLILYHVALAYNTWGEANYIFFSEVKPIASIVTLISPWFMPLMFLLAGVSSRFSLQKRGIKSFIKERFLRLGIPFVFGLLILNPILSYVADVSHNAYQGNYLEHYGVYFTRYTDLSGYDGGFTFGHFWFLLVLIIISLFALVVNKLVPENKSSFIVLEIVCTIGAIATFDIDILGKKVFCYFFCYLLGYYFVSNQEFLSKINKYKWIFVAAFLVFDITNTVLFIYVGSLETLNTVCNYLTFATSLPALVLLGYSYLNFSNKVTSFASKTSYVFYIVHFPIAILCQYLLNILDVNYIVNFFISLLISYPLCIGCCYLIEKTRYIRVIFGQKARIKRPENQA